MGRTRLVFKREKKAARKIAAVSVLCCAVLAMYREFLPSALSAASFIAASRASLQRELHWRKFHGRTPWNWGAWTEGECQAVCGFRRAAIDQITQVSRPCFFVSSFC